MSKRVLLCKEVFRNKELIEESKVLYSSISRASEEIISVLSKTDDIVITKDGLGREIYAGTTSDTTIFFNLVSKPKEYTGCPIKMPNGYKKLLDKNNLLRRLKVQDVNPKELQMQLEYATQGKWNVQVLKDFEHPLILIDKVAVLKNTFLCSYTERELKVVEDICKENDWSYSVWIDKENMVLYIKLYDK